MWWANKDTNIKHLKLSQLYKLNISIGLGQNYSNFLTLEKLEKLKKKKNTNSYKFLILKSLRLKNH